MSPFRLYGASSTCRDEGLGVVALNSYSTQLTRNAPLRGEPEKYGQEMQPVSRSAETADDVASPERAVGLQYRPFLAHSGGCSVNQKHQTAQAKYLAPKIGFEPTTLRLTGERLIRQ